MKHVLYCCFLLFAYTWIVPTTSMAQSRDETADLQKAFNDPTRFVVVIERQTVVNGYLNIPDNKVLKFTPGGLITGKGYIYGGTLEGSYQQQLFDTGITVNPSGVAQHFSVKWYGAKGNDTDDYQAIQTSINTCVRNKIRSLYIPAGKYKISQPLIIQGNSSVENGKTKRWFCTLEVIGESAFWDSNKGTEIIPTFTNTFAIGIQTGKGCKIRNLKIDGRFKPPFSGQPKLFFNSAFEKFTDGVCRDSRYSPYAGIVIDPFTNRGADGIPADSGYPGLASYYGQADNLDALSGSTATQLEQLSISGFVVGVCSSPNGISKNAELTIVDKVQFENCKLAISGGQAQEKMNRISNIACWGGTHTIFATGLYGSDKEAGNWYIDHVNIAGGVVRFVYNNQQGYFPLYISSVYAESLGSWGTINSELATEISNCAVDFADTSLAGERTLLTSWGKCVIYRNCNFRYYGTLTELTMEGNCTFDNCFFSGKLIQSTGSEFSLKNVGSDPFSRRSLATIILLISVVSVVAMTLLFFMYLRQRKKYNRLKNSHDPLQVL